MKTSKRSDPAGVLFISRSPVETRKLAASVASLLDGGETILLHGGLGAGKTCFVQGLAAGLGIAAGACVVSPTFTLVNEYPGPHPLCHVDLYRLESPGEIRALGLEEYLGRAVTAVEWAEKLPTELRQPTIEVLFAVRGTREREILLTAGDARGSAIIRALGKRPQT
jgi:tRNA threonylcarbamoyladenosine biosynthesis protein TsaE